MICTFERLGTEIASCSSIKTELIAELIENKTNKSDRVTL